MYNIFTSLTLSFTAGYNFCFIGLTKPKPKISSSTLWILCKYPLGCTCLVENHWINQVFNYRPESEKYTSISSYLLVYIWVISFYCSWRQQHHPTLDVIRQKKVTFSETHMLICDSNFWERQNKNVKCSRLAACKNFIGIFQTPSGDIKTHRKCNNMSALKQEQVWWQFLAQISG